MKPNPRGDTMNETEKKLTAQVAMQAALIKNLLRLTKYDDFVAGFNDDACDLIKKANTNAPPDAEYAAALETAFHKIGFDISP